MRIIIKTMVKEEADEKQLGGIAPWFTLRVGTRNTHAKKQLLHKHYVLNVIR